VEVCCSQHQQGFGPVQHPVDDEEVVALPHQALCVVLEGQVMGKRVLFPAPSGTGISKKNMIKV
jgi:hypothetical protein